MARQAKLKKMGKTTAIDESKLQRYFDPRLVVAFSHSVREHILAVLNDEIASPAAVARQLGVTPAYLNYHFEELEKNGLIELVKTEPRRGSIEHFYRASETLFLDGEDWERVPAQLKTGISGSHLTSLYGEVGRALAAGMFCKADAHLSVTPMMVDQKGWGDAIAAVDETLYRVMAIRAESIERLAAGAEPIPMMVALMGFETAPA